jgi:hypothetical protein
MNKIIIYLILTFVVIYNAFAQTKYKQLEYGNLKFIFPLEHVFKDTLNVKFHFAIDTINFNKPVTYQMFIIDTASTKFNELINSSICTNYGVSQVGTNQKCTNVKKVEYKICGIDKSYEHALLNTFIRISLKSFEGKLLHYKDIKTNNCEAITREYSIKYMVNNETQILISRVVLFGDKFIQLSQTGSVKDLSLLVTQAKYLFEQMQVNQ